MQLAEPALPTEGQSATEASGQPNADQLADTNADQPANEGEKTSEAEGEDKQKPTKTPEQREIDRLRRGLDRRTRQLYDARAKLDLTRAPIQENNRTSASDSEPLSLTRAELDQIVKAEAAKLAPTLKEQATEQERRQGVIQSLAKTWGTEKFDEVSSDLDDAFGGLADSSGKPKPATEAVFEADNPAAVIEYLADPDNIDEAESIARMNAVQAGKAIAKLEAKISASAAKDKPKASKAPAPLEVVRGQGSVTAGPDPSDTKAWIAYRNEQERKGR